MTRAAAGTRGGGGRIVAMAAALAVGLALVLAGTARGQAALPGPIGLTVVDGDQWRAENDFDLFWANPWNLPVAGASWRIRGPGYVGPVATVAAAGINHLDDVRVPAAGEWDLAVWLHDASGADLRVFGAAATLRLDDAPPAVAFVPGDSDALPARLVAVAADPHSGLAAGTISYRRLDEARWTELETTARAGALGTELVATPPELMPGAAYLFQAQARDRAGNVGATTMRADGTPMEIQAPAAAPGSGRGPGPGNGRDDGAARRTRLLAGLAVGRGRGRARVTVAAGHPALLRGALVAAGAASRRGGRSAGPAADVEGRRLRVVIRPAAGSRAARRVEPLVTGPGGRFQLRLRPGPSRRLTVVFPGAAGLRPARRRLRLRVRAAVSLTAAPRRLRTGGRLRLEGRVGSRGARVPRAGKLVTISYWEREARRWRPVIVTRSDRRGRFRAGYRFRYVSGRARIRLRAEAPAEARWPYAAGASRPLTVEVRG